MNFPGIPIVYVKEGGGERVIDHYIQAYGKRLYGLCLTLCKNPSDAEDLYQDTWLKVMANAERVDPSRPFEPWLTRICYRNTLRRLMRNPIFNGFATGEEKDRLMEAAYAESPSDYSDLHTAVDCLPEKLRLVIILFYFRDMDIRSTAEVLQIPEGTVKSRLHKAKFLLKEVLHDDTNL